MTDQLIKQLIDLIQSSERFVLDQAPDVARQAVLYGRIENVAQLIFALLAGYLLFALMRLTNRSVSSGKWDDIAWAPVGVVGGIAAIACTILAGNSIDHGVQAFFAPKLYLLEYLSTLAKGCGK